MQQAELKQGYVTPDGKVFATKAEANDHLRRPLITKALNALTHTNEQLSAWLLEMSDSIEAAFECTKVSRVTKAERKKLEAALEALKLVDVPKLKFLQDNAAAVLESFRWPAVKRQSEEEQAKTIRDAFMTLTEGNVELTDWIIANREHLIEAFKAGIVKKEVNPAASSALAAYREKKAAEKAAAEAAKAAEGGAGEVQASA